MRSETTRLQAINRNGFVMPVVILAMVILGAMTLAALATANDEVRSSRAIRESGTALYAAEAGANLLLATVVDSPSTVLDTLAENMSPGDSVDFSWSTLPNGASYRAIFYQYGSQSYLLSLTGRDTGLRPGEQSISLALGPVVASLGGFSLVSSVSGGYDEAELNGGVSGLDYLPPQYDAGSCPPMDDVPGITWRTNDMSGGPVQGNPPTVIDGSLDPFDFGDHDWNSLVAMATITLGGDPGSYIQPIVSGSDCVEHNLNWGDPLDLSSPCADRFPIIYSPGSLEIESGGYGQGILIVDGELRIRNSAFTFYGLIMNRGGRMRFEDNTRVYGGIVAGEELRLEDATQVRYSSCAAQRATNGAVGGGTTVLEPIDSRSWSASLR